MMIERAHIKSAVRVNATFVDVVLFHPGLREEISYTLPDDANRDDAFAAQVRALVSGIKIEDRSSELAKVAERADRVAELKRLLAESDFKVMPDYDQPNDDVVAQRQTWRDEIRSLTGTG